MEFEHVYFTSIISAALRTARERAVGCGRGFATQVPLAILQRWFWVLSHRLLICFSSVVSADQAPQACEKKQQPQSIPLCARLRSSLVVSRLVWLPPRAQRGPARWLLVSCIESRHGLHQSVWLAWIFGQTLAPVHSEILTFLRLDRLLVMDPDKRLGANGVHEAASRPRFCDFPDLPQFMAIESWGDIGTLYFEPWGVVFAFQTLQRDPLWFLNSAVFSSGEEQQLVQIGQLFLGAVGSESPSNFKHRNIRRTVSWVVVEPFPCTLQILKLSIKVNWDQRPAFGDGESSYFHQPGLLPITTNFCWLTSSPLLVKINIFHHLHHLSFFSILCVLLSSLTQLPEINFLDPGKGREIHM